MIANCTTGSASNITCHVATSQQEPSMSRLTNPNMPQLGKMPPSHGSRHTQCFLRLNICTVQDAPSTSHFCATPLALITHSSPIQSSTNNPHRPQPHATSTPSTPAPHFDDMSRVLLPSNALASSLHGKPRKYTRASVQALFERVPAVRETREEEGGCTNQLPCAA